MWGSPGVNHSSGGWSIEARGIVKPGRWLCSQEKGYFPWDPSYLQRACMLSDAFTVIVPCCPHPSRWVVASITLSAWKRRRLRERVLHSGSRWASQPSLQAGPRWSVLLRNPTHPTGQLQETDAAMGEAIVVTQSSKAQSGLWRPHQSVSHHNPSRSHCFVGQGLFKECHPMDIPAGPIVKILHFPCRACGFDPWSRNEDPTCPRATELCATWKDPSCHN